MAPDHSDRIGNTTPLLIDSVQRPALVHRDVIRLVTFDLVLWIILGAATHVPFVFGVMRMHVDDPSRDVTGFRIPTHMIPDLEPGGIIGAAAMVVAHFSYPTYLQTPVAFIGIK